MELIFKNKIDTGYKPLGSFIPLHSRSQKNAVVIAGRGAGKTTAVINELINKALTGDDGAHYAYINTHNGAMNTYVRDIFQTYIKTIRGLKYSGALDGFQILFPNRATINSCNWFNIEHLRGMRLAGVVLDETPSGDFMALLEENILRPARHGWIIVIGTNEFDNNLQKFYDYVPSDDWLKLDLTEKDVK